MLSTFSDCSEVREGVEVEKDIKGINGDGKNNNTVSVAKGQHLIVCIQATFLFEGNSSIRLWVGRNVLFSIIILNRTSSFILYPEAAGLRKMKGRMIDNLVTVPASWDKTMSDFSAELWDVIEL